MEQFVIWNETIDEFWSNEYGWSPNLYDADHYYADEKEGLNLPMGGQWHVVDVLAD